MQDLIKMKTEKKVKELIHEGEKLSELIDYLEMSREKFCDQIGITSAWLRRIVKRKAIPQKNKMLIYREFNVPKGYWNNTYTLPSKKLTESAVKQTVSTGKGYSINDLQECKNLLLEKDKMIINLQQRIIQLMERGNG